MNAQDEAKKPRQFGVVVGKRGESHLIKGWHERETDGRHGIPYRASTDDGRIMLRRSPIAKSINLIITGPVSLHRGIMRGYLIVNRQKYELPLDIDAWVLRSYPLETEEKILDVRLFLKDPIVPDNILHNGDSRRLGWYLSAIWQE